MPAGAGTPQKPLSPHQPHPPRALRSSKVSTRLAAPALESWGDGPPTCDRRSRFPRLQVAAARYPAHPQGSHTLPRGLALMDATRVTVRHDRQSCRGTPRTPGARGDLPQGAPTRPSCPVIASPATQAGILTFYGCVAQERRARGEHYSSRALKLPTSRNVPGIRPEQARPPICRAAICDIVLTLPACRDRLSWIEETT